MVTVATIPARQHSARARDSSSLPQILGGGGGGHDDLAQGGGRTAAIGDTLADVNEGRLRA